MYELALASDTLEDQRMASVSLASRAIFARMGIRAMADRLLGRRPTDLRTRNVFGSQIAIIDPSTLSLLGDPGPGAVVGSVPTTALAVPAVYRAVNMIQASIAGMRWRSWWPDSNTLVERQPHILRMPDPFEPRDTTVRQMATEMLLYGEAFLHLSAPDATGYPTNAIPIPHGEVTLTWNQLRTRARYRWRNTELFQYRTILHLKYLDVPGFLHGLGPIQMARQSVAGGVLADSMATDYYTSGGIVDGVLENPEKMTDKEADRLAEQWAQGQGGKRGVPVLEGGMTFKAMSMNNHDAQFIEGRNFTVQDIGRLFGIPAPLLNASMPGSSLQYRNQEGIATEYASQAVQPVTEVIEAAFGMVVPTTQEVRFDFSQLLRADAPTRYRVYDVALKDRILSINEVRALERLAPIPGGGDIPETGWVDESGAEPLILQSDTTNVSLDSEAL